jgi:hypothetical protein
MLDRNGEVLWADVASREGDQLVLSIPPPFEVQLAVHDEKGKPLAGVTIHHHIRNYWFTASMMVQGMFRFRCLWPVCGVTDAAGRLRVRVGVEGHDADHPVQSLHFLARKPGYRSSLSGIQDGQPYRNGHMGAADGVEFTLVPVPPLLVKLGESPSVPARESPAWFTWRVQVHAADGRSSHGLPFQELGRAGAGSIAFAAAPPDGDELEAAWTLLPDAAHQRLVVAGGAVPATGRPDIVGTPAGGYELRFPDQEYRRIQVSEADGRPAERAVVMVMPTVDGHPDLAQRYLVRTDRLGRARIATTPAGVRVAVVTRTGAGGRTLRSDDKEPWQLPLEPLATVQGRVLDTDHKPVAGVSIRISDFDVGDNGIDDAAIAPREVACLYEALPAMKSDAEGRFKLVYVRCAGSLVFAAADPVGRWQVVERPSFPSTGEETELEIRVSAMGK